MNETPNVVVVMARCCRSGQGFGIRFEEKARGRWMADWAFVIREQAARKEGYDKSEARGDFGFDGVYPGCPFCRSHIAFRCSCGKVACWDGENRIVTCPWCGYKGELSGSVTSLRVGGDR